MADTEIRPGHTDHDRLTTEWERNGQSSTFEEIGEFGGRRWQAINREAEEGPTFLLDAAAGPTDPGHDKPVGWKPTKGYEVEMTHDPGLQIIEGPEAYTFRLKMRRQPKDVTV